MADIFISYSHPDRTQARELAAWLEGEGYSVWWDTALKAGDDFQSEIHKQIWPAKAVIVMWSAASTKSMWVRAEAAAAQRDGKLIPVKLAGVAYEDIMQPFNLLHTEDFANKALIKVALQSQLAKPAPAPRILKQIKYEALMWFGVIGAAITVFSGLDSIIRLANWAKWLSYYWVDYTNQFWQTLAAIIRIDFPKHLTGPLTFLVFFFGAIIGSRLSRQYKPRKLSPTDIILNSILSFFMAIAVIILIYLLFKFAGYVELPIFVFFTLMLLCITIGFAGLGALWEREKIDNEKLWKISTYNALIMVLLYYVISMKTLSGKSDILIYTGVIFLFLMSMMYAFTSPLALNRRLIYTLLTVLTLAGLSTISTYLPERLDAPPVPGEARAAKR